MRVLAGLIHKVGLVRPEQANLAGSGLTAYKQFSSDVAPGLDLNALTDAGDEDVHGSSFIEPGVGSVTAPASASSDSGSTSSGEKKKR